MTGAFLGFVALAVLGTTGLLAASVVRIRPLAEVILAVYVVASAEVVGLFLLLSAFNAVSRGALIAGLVIVLAAVFAVWVLIGNPRVATFTRRAPVSLLRHRPLGVLAFGVCTGFAYIAALIVGTPPNGWDPMNYHLARAALWVQSGGLGYIRAAYDQRINFNPPNGEIGFAFALGVTRNENFVGFVQFFAALASAVAVFALARRIGLRRSEAAFGALTFLALPLVALQSSGAKNDVIVAAYLMAAAVFLLRDSRREIVLGTAATALAVGTKFTAAYGLPILLALILVAPAPRRQRLTRLGALALGGLAGSYWYVVNAYETGRFLGDQSNVPGLTAPLHPPENLLTAFGALVDAIDLSGARGADIFIYAIAALACVAAVTHWNERAIVLATVGAGPLLLLFLTRHVGQPALVRLYDALGQPKGYLGTGDSTATSPTTASDTVSWYGPAGLALVVGAAIVAVRLVRRRFLPRAVLAAAAAPLGCFVLIALTLTYNPWLGRFFVFPVALSAALWGLALRSNVAAWTVVALATVTLGLSLAHYDEKPSGLRLLDRSAPTTSVWSMPRWEVQSLHDPPIGPVFRFLDQDVPRSASIALALGANDFGYPAFGPHLDRRVDLVPFGSSARDLHDSWLMASPDRVPEIDSSCWREAFRSEEATVFRRAQSCDA